MPWITVNSEPPKPPTFEDLGYVQVVRCKDCKHSKDEYGGMFCPKFGFVHQEDWFCADGERGGKCE